ncbi:MULTISPECIES: paraquat-inducible protein A [Burkholderia]|uniref:paraquat-inducible protein A n=1 Tax=Burkholderia TaxID=32008 RepID=UPI000B79B377|nr:MULTISPECIES: paraquat-inducible protein A [Burkholderia]MBY4727410.1 paraquat-inducible protein A [Burkholderia contaminans]MCI3974156.1 paraquat-inducible protein A [Burkholderia sp. HI4860]MDN7792117.1 paraquat-inducible protein A [Burkholderia contaminans]OXI93803.1 PqiA protein [Burkholderia sp. AU33647]
MKPENLVACHECDLLFWRPPRLRALAAHCPRCRARVGGSAHGRPALDRRCAIALAALFTLVIAQAFPIVALDAAGIASHATLADAVAALRLHGQPAVAAIVFCTTMLFPLLELAAWLYVLVPLRAGRIPPRFEPVLRNMQRLRPWSMVEVFLLGILVTIVKMTSVAHVIPGPALFAFGALTVMLGFLASFDPGGLWEARDEIIALRGDGTSAAVSRRRHTPRRAAPVTPDTADAPNATRATRRHRPASVTTRAAGLVACHTCGRVQPHTEAADARCTRCGSTLHERRPRSAARTGALVIAAALLYIPANLLPIMHATSLGRAEDDTILAGVAYFWTSGDWPLAVVVFVASVLVPMLKLAILALQAIAAHRGTPWRPLERARLHRLVERVGRWSMLDVFVVALTIALVHFGSFAEITPGPGALAFGAVVVLTMCASMQFDPRLIWDGAHRAAASPRS